MICETLDSAVKHHRTGRLQDAGRLYEEVLRAEPNHPDALHLLGLVAFQLGDHETAVERISRAIALNGNVASYHSNLAAAQRAMGQLDEAVGHCQKAVRIDPAHAPAHTNLGNALAGQGKIDEAVTALRRALQIRPDDVDVLHSLGYLLKSGGKYDEAEASLRRLLEIQPDHLDARNSLGNLLQSRGRIDEAEACFREVLQFDPRFSKARNNLGNILQDQGKLDEAEDCYRRALQVHPDSSKALNNLGVVMLRRRMLAEAESYFRRSLEAQPKYADAINNLGNVLQEQGRLDEAEAYYREVLEVQPQLAQVYNGLGAIFQRRRQSEIAESYYRRALEVQPDYADALANLAALLEKLNRLDEAEPVAEQCLRINPTHPQANLVTAKCEQRDGRYQEAIERLDKASPFARPYIGIAKDVQFQLGKLYDRTGDSAKAFTHLAEGNRLAVREHAAAPGTKKLRYTRAVDTSAETFTAEWLASWSPPVPLSEGGTPAFLVGFPRSGTTLVDVILDAHPEIQTLEEKPTVYAMEQEIDALPDRFPRAMAGLTPPQIESLRSAYFCAVDRFIDRRPAALIVDKHPLNSAAVGLILRVFPDAKFIMMVRHPCDVCLSCFMQNFELNNAMSNFTSLEDTVALYDKVMRLWRQYVRLMPHPHHIVKYENLIEDFDGETRKLLRFLDVEWDDTVLDYVEHAKQRGWIRTASYHQVVEPIYRRARDRWRRYAEQLAGVTDVLAPHIEYFGYTESS